MADQQPETAETLGEAFDYWLLEAPPAEFEEFLAEAPQLLSTKPLEFLRDCKARVDARLAAEPARRIFMGDPHEVRVRYWYQIAERFGAEIKWRESRSAQDNPARLAENPVRRGPERQHAVAARRTVVRQNADVSDEELCKILDREHIRLPQGWRDAGFRTWTEAFHLRRRRIHVIFSKDRKAD